VLIRSRNSGEPPGAAGSARCTLGRPCAAQTNASRSARRIDLQPKLLRQAGELDVLGDLRVIDQVSRQNLQPESNASEDGVGATTRPLAAQRQRAGRPRRLAAKFVVA
jgi:hypothetical protein